MAFGVKVNGAFLDIDDRSQLTFEINTELWVTGEPSVNLGSYSFPFDIFLTDNNRYLLRFPDRIDAYTPLQKIEGAIVYIGEGKSIGLPVFTGDLYVKSSGRHRASLFMIVEGLGKQKEKKFEDVDMGVYNLAPPLLLENIMTATTTAPLDHDFIFFPVWNESLLSAYRGTDKIPDYFINIFALRTMNYYINDWYIKTETDNDLKVNTITTPFLRLEYVLDKLAENIGYALVNELIGDDEELKKICVFNNKSINDVDLVYKWKIKYNEHLPSKMKLVDFLVHICTFFFCGCFVDHFSKTITIRPYKKLLAQNARQNWTERQVNDYDIEVDSKVPYSIGYQDDGTDDYFSNNFVGNAPIIADGAVITDYWKAGGNPNSHSLIDGYYHVKRDNSVMRYDPSRTFLYERWSKYNHIFRRIIIGGTGNPVLFKVVPMWSESGSPIITYTYAHSIPRADIPINARFRFADDEIAEHTGELSSIRLMIYRGLKNYQGGMSGTFPYANATAYDPATESETYNHSLHMDGGKGLYKKRGKEWMEFLRRKKIVTMKLKLTVQDILNHREYDKVRVDNMDYFVKSIRVSVSGAGIGISDVTLVSCPFTAMEDV
jgi:hypothetical protein